MPKYRFDGMPRVTLRNIRRLETDGCGWRVNVKRQRQSHVKYFPDGWDGPFDSLRRAIEWRDAQWEVHGAPTHVPRNATRRSNTGILGVSLEVQELASGRVVESYRAYWTTEHGKRARRSFSIDKFGRAEAKQMAIRARKEGAAEAEKRRRTKLLDVLHTHKQLVRKKAAEV